MGDWDDSLKTFISENAQDFATWILKGSRVERKLLTEFKIRTIEADCLLEVSEDDMPLLLQIEIQSKRDPNIGERLLEYSFEAMHEHHLPVFSCVIYLRDVGEVPQPPLRWQLPNGREVLWFDYVSIELANIPTDEFRQMGLIGLLPLLILTKDGATHQVMEEVIAGLEAAEKPELLPIVRLLAELVFTSGGDLEWIERIFAMHDEIFAQTPTYQRLVKKGREEGLEEGLQKGLEALRQTVVDVVQERFPEIAILAQKQVAGVEDTTLLRHLIVKMSTVQTVQEAIQLLISIDSNAKKN
jgi:predicted transposase YdaD